MRANASVGTSHGRSTLRLIGAAAVLGMVLAACSSNADDGNGSAEDTGGTSSAIEPAPAFEAAEIARPAPDWPTHGGSLTNQRFSPLDDIGRDNVERLGAVWRTRLGSGVGSRYSNEATPVVHDGVLYITTGENDVFALDAGTGEQLWQYAGNLPPESEIPSICCAWANRGVALGDGRVYLGKLTGDVVAIDQQDGSELWSTSIGDPEIGETITAAPLYVDGLVISGLSGGEYGVRGRILTLDAATGEEVWRFWTVPGPGELGHDTWPQDNDAWQVGGSVVWQTPAVDPELGLIYFGTSNPGELFNGADRAGKNLFGNSIVALDLETGEYRWHFQQVHHDLWDYDSASPVVLFDIELDGELRHGIAEPNKNGFVYVLDRETGEPLLPIEERPVPQDESQHTWPTQPFPVGDAYVPQEIPQSLFEELDQARSGVLGEWEYVNGGEIYTPPTEVGAIAKPATLGGANWPPSSFSPDTGYLYVCASDTVSIFATEDVDYDPAQIQAGKQFLGSAFANPSGAPLKGTVTAMDMTDNRIAWQQNWGGAGDNCYSGMLSTAGGLVFVGRNDGRLMGYDAEDGTELWSYQTGAGANAPAVSFEHDGRQHVALLSGGNALAGSPQGDIVTAFALDGDVEPLPQPAPRSSDEEVGKPSEGGT